MACWRCTRRDCVACWWPRIHMSAANRFSPCAELQTTRWRPSRVVLCDLWFVRIKGRSRVTQPRESVNILKTWIIVILSRQNRVPESETPRSLRSSYLGLNTVVWAIIFKLCLCALVYSRARSTASSYVGLSSPSISMGRTDCSWQAVGTMCWLHCTCWLTKSNGWIKWRKVSHGEMGSFK